MAYKVGDARRVPSVATKVPHGLGAAAVIAAVLTGCCCFTVPHLFILGPGSDDALQVIMLAGAFCMLSAAGTFLALVVSGQGSLEAEEEDVGAVLDRCVPVADLTVSDTKSAEGSEDVVRELGGVGQDPVWDGDADWSNLDRLAKKTQSRVARCDSEPWRPPVEVYELNDTPTWLARMQQRREQAMRSGKDKLVQKLDKEIAEVRKLYAAQSAEKQSGSPEAAAAAAAAMARAQRRRTDEHDPSSYASEDVYGLDWTAVTAKAAPGSSDAATNVDA